MEPFSELSQYAVDPRAASLLDAAFCLERQVAVLGEPAERVTVGMLDPGDQALVASVTELLGRPIQPVQLNAYEIRKALARLYGLPLGEGEGPLLRLDADNEIRFTSGQGAPEILNGILGEAIRRHATDVHLEAYEGDIDVRLRVDGVLIQVVTPLSPDNHLRVLSRIKVLCGLDPVERRHAQDGHFGVLWLEGRNSRRIDVRVSILPGAHGQDAALRLLDPRRFEPDLEGLGMSAAMKSQCRRLLRRPHGLILACGSTGSGKTTTLYAFLDALRGADLKVLTVEDPVERELPKVNQKAVTPQMGFAEHLRAFLRANPDVILVGEIRDRETADVAIRAATTGHLVLSTLHTKDALGAVARLRALGVSDDLLSDVLSGVIGQRLLRRVCEKCAAPVEPREDLVREYCGPAPGRGFRRGKGCPACWTTGYRGQVGIFELLRPEPEFLGALGRGATMEELRRIASQTGWSPMVEDAVAKAEAGLTTLEEVARRFVAMERR